MKANLSNVAKHFFPNPSLEMVYFEAIANSIDALTVWFEEIDKDDWSSRMQYYLSEFHKLVPKDKVDA